MPTLKLDYNKSMEVSSKEKFRVKVSQKSGTSLERRQNGLYANAPKGDPGSSGNGYPDGYQSANVLLCGYEDWIQSGESLVVHPGRISAHHCVHRIFNAADEQGNGIPLRTMDTLYPGDMYRYRDETHGGWLYRIILKTTGREITSYSKIVAAIPDSYTEVN